MKIRSDFVTNSSSSSFIINDVAKLTEFQRNAIINHSQIVRVLNMTEFIESHGDWNITVTEGSISGYTTMDNFDMVSYFNQIQVDPKLVEWDY